MNRLVKLMIITQKDTGLKYFCRSATEGLIFDNYYGSGTYLKNHINKHGKNSIKQIAILYNITE